MSEIELEDQDVDADVDDLQIISNAKLDSNQGIPVIEVKRRQPLEEQHNCFLNLLLCFIVPFVCRCQPVVDEDMPATMKKDRSYDVMRSLSPRWRKVFQEYQAEVNDAKLTGRRYTDKSAEFSFISFFHLILFLDYI